MSQQDLLLAPQAVQVCRAMSFLALPCPTVVPVVEHPSRWCIATDMVGRPPATRIRPPLACMSGTCFTTSWHLGHDMGRVLGAAAWVVGTADRRLSFISRSAPFLTPAVGWAPRRARRASQPPRSGSNTFAGSPFSYSSLSCVAVSGGSRSRSRSPLRLPRCLPTSLKRKRSTR